MQFPILKIPTSASSSFSDYCWTTLPRVKYNCTHSGILSIGSIHCKCSRTELVNIAWGQICDTFLISSLTFKCTLRKKKNHCILQIRIDKYVKAHTDISREITRAHDGSEKFSVSPCKVMSEASDGVWKQRVWFLSAENDKFG